ncbi:GNAT family N-acetyltransferase [Chitinimonas lacunae]|uniref:GNAT family N-acetyltransferase n=1 Tax=Chitinimonas lacunae TaxID=1963018 RepID=A0ABV8MLD6_9NEIS
MKTPTPPPFPVLHTERLLLRELTPADAEPLYAIHSDHEAMRWFGSDPLTQPQQAFRLIEIFAEWRRAPAPGTRWALVRREDQLLVGTCGLFRWNPNWRNCVVGYELGRAAWGQGLMTEAMRAVLEYGFEVMQVNRIQAEIHPDNLPSIRLVEKLGFALEGVHREQAFWANAYHDLACYSLLQRDWRALQR